MGFNSEISWTHHTYNPWWGCVKVSPGCEHCYALSLSKRWGFDIWGPAKTTQRRMMSENYWKQPLKWNKDAETTGQRKRVFCASMADVFEANPQLTESKSRLFELIEQTPWLDWLLLTKRPENIMGMIPYAWHSDPRPNVWYGTSVENQEQADKRIPELLKVPAHVRFLSCEPLLGAVDISRWLPPAPGVSWAHEVMVAWGEDTHTLDWIIGGGESGPEARYCETGWARSLRDQCVAAGVAFHWKQWGEYVPASQAPEGTQPPALGPRSRRKKAAFAQLFGEPSPDDVYWRVGKRAAGRLLDGRTWDEFPQ